MPLIRLLIRTISKMDTVLLAITILSFLILVIMGFQYMVKRISRSECQYEELEDWEGWQEYINEPQDEDDVKWDLKPEHNILRPILTIGISIILFAVLITACLGGFTQIHREGVMTLEYQGNSVWESVYSTDYPLIVRESFRWPWEDKVTDYVYTVLPDSFNIGYGSYELPEGTFYLDAPIKLSSNTSLHGKGEDSVIRLTLENSTGALEFDSGTYNVGIQNIYIVEDSETSGTVN